MKKLLLMLFFLPSLVFAQQSRGYNLRPLNVPLGNINKSNVVLIDNIPSYIWA